MLGSSKIFDRKIHDYAGYNHAPKKNIFVSLWPAFNQSHHGVWHSQHWGHIKHLFPNSFYHSALITKRLKNGITVTQKIINSPVGSLKNEMEFLKGSAERKVDLVRTCNAWLCSKALSIRIDVSDEEAWAASAFVVNLVFISSSRSLSHTSRSRCFA